jgi:hypothetical protein
MPDTQVPTETKPAIEALLKLAHYVELRDHVSGRIEMRVSFANVPKVLAILQDLDIDRGLKLIPGLKDYEVSAWSRSAVIRYDPRVFPMDLWNDFCTIGNDPAKEEALRERLLSLFGNHGGGKGD